MPWLNGRQNEVWSVAGFELLTAGEQQIVAFATTDSALAIPKPIKILRRKMTRLHALHLAMMLSG